MKQKFILSSVILSFASLTLLTGCGSTTSSSTTTLSSQEKTAIRSIAQAANLKEKGKTSALSIQSNCTETKYEWTETIASQNASYSYTPRCKNNKYAGGIYTVSYGTYSYSEDYSYEEDPQNTNKSNNISVTATFTNDGKSVTLKVYNGSNEFTYNGDDKPAHVKFNYPFALSASGYDTDLAGIGGTFNRDKVYDTPQKYTDDITSNGIEALLLKEEKPTNFQLRLFFDQNVGGLVFKVFEKVNNEWVIVQ